jgi:hypothetical protein
MARLVLEASVRHGRCSYLWRHVFCIFRAKVDRLKKVYFSSTGDALATHTLTAHIEENDVDDLRALTPGQHAVVEVIVDSTPEGFVYPHYNSVEIVDGPMQLRATVNAALPGQFVEKHAGEIIRVTFESPEVT